MMMDQSFAKNMSKKSNVTSENETSKYEEKCATLEKKSKIAQL